MKTVMFPFFGSHRQAAVSGAADYGLRTVVQDALCSASDEAHDAMIDVFSSRNSQHIETATTDQV